MALSAIFIIGAIITISLTLGGTRQETVSSKAVLFLSTYDDRNVSVDRNRNQNFLKHTLDSHTPQLIGPIGNVPTSFDFNNKEVDGACAVTHKNIHYIFGGSPTDNKQVKRQVLQVTNCGLTAIHWLPFDHENGACSSSNGTIILCFSKDSLKQCRRATTPTGQWSAMSSLYDHGMTSIATSKGKDYLIF